MAADPAQRVKDAGLDALALVRARLAGDNEAARIMITLCDRRLVAATLADWLAHFVRQQFGDAADQVLAGLAEAARDG